MEPAFRVRIVVFASGERFPVLLDEHGCSLFRPTVFALTQVRGRNLSTNTISNVLRAIVVLEHFLAARRIDIDSRLEYGELLSVAEVEGLIRSSRQPLAELGSRTTVSCTQSKKPALAKEAVRTKPHGQRLKEVAPQVASTRLLYIRSYLAWLADDRRSRNGVSNAFLARLQSATEITFRALDSRMRYSPAAGLGVEREGLSDRQVQELLRVTDPSSTDNPWRDEHARYRNALLVRWLLNLGLRIGEALGVRNSDIDSRLGEVTIHRRADDPLSPRAKARKRPLPFLPWSVRLLYRWDLAFHESPKPPNSASTLLRSMPSPSSDTRMAWSPLSSFGSRMTLTCWAPASDRSRSAPRLP